ncbi:hypothetical protein HYH03_019072 [Edaphochlamys debaryana]|uniref:Uncharacterized protein n=1 Tax=Edaphochlamys debaryana TaxID=47281 RepID=A0A835XEQ0_9CHLO|nr:hypothetical protein HYH03_019072 [Edaphochlamys debaryana]|eukprot:KAG2481979.1 hypothetical protein HYH03_019072 [Edaphochlamys debaryana]
MLPAGRGRGLTADGLRRRILPQASNVSALPPAPAAYLLTDALWAALGHATSRAAPTPQQTRPPPPVPPPRPPPPPSSSTPWARLSSTRAPTPGSGSGSPRPPPAAVTILLTPGPGRAAGGGAAGGGDRQRHRVPPAPCRRRPGAPLVPDAAAVDHLACEPGLAGARALALGHRQQGGEGGRCGPWREHTHPNGGSLRLISLALLFVAPGAAAAAVTSGLTAACAAPPPAPPAPPPSAAWAASLDPARAWACSGPHWTAWAWRAAAAPPPPPPATC